MEQKRPTPPAGYIPFEWRTRHEGDITVQLCPACGETGSVWQGGGFQDSAAEKLIQELEEKGIRSYELYCTQYEGVMLKLHWSRYGEGECSHCGARFWHDFIGYPWAYYYDPSTSKVPHYYQPTFL